MLAVLAKRLCTWLCGAVESVEGHGITRLKHLR